MYYVLHHKVAFDTRHQTQVKYKKHFVENEVSLISLLFIYPHLLSNLKHLASSYFIT